MRHHPTDGALGLLVTTIARASGIWRREIGISFVLCKKQAQLLLPNRCDASEVAASSGCGSSMELCWCTSSGNNTCGSRRNRACEPDQCRAPVECAGSHARFGYRCFADAMGCNILPDNAVSQIIGGPLSIMLDRMGVHASSDDYDLAHYFTISQTNNGLGGGSVCSKMPGGKAMGGTASTDPTGGNDAMTFAHVSAVRAPPFAHAVPARELICPHPAAHRK